MITLEVCPNTFFSYVETHILKLDQAVNKGKSVVLFPFIYDFFKILIFNLSETIGR